MYREYHAHVYTYVTSTYCMGVSVLHGSGDYERRKMFGLCSHQGMTTNTAAFSGMGQGFHLMSSVKGLIEKKRERERQRQRERERETDRQTHRHTDSQTDRQTDRDRETQRE